MKKGILYGVSTGPGDPELMTLKAIRTLEKVPVIAAPRTKGDHTVALDIVKAIMDLTEKEILYLDFAMKKKGDLLEETHRLQAEAIEVRLAGGLDVAMLNIGDASLYGTFCYIRDRVAADGYETVTIPGVTSFCAVAATLGQSLTTMGETLTVIPGSFEQVSDELDRPGSKVIMKSGKVLSEVRRLIEEKGLLERSAMVANCGFENQKILKDLRMAGEDEGYFVTILIEGQES